MTNIKQTGFLTMTWLAANLALPAMAQLHQPTLTEFDAPGAGTVSRPRAQTRWVAALRLSPSMQRELSWVSTQTRTSCRTASSALPRATLLPLMPPERAWGMASTRAPSHTASTTWALPSLWPGWVDRYINKPASCRLVGLAAVLFKNSTGLAPAEGLLFRGT